MPASNVSSDPPLEVGFIHFKTCTPLHFERAWVSLSRQEGLAEMVKRVTVYDNNTPEPPEALVAVMDDHPMPAGIETRLIIDKHGQEDLTHAYSLNRVLEAVKERWVCITRSDYLLTTDAIKAMLHRATDLYMSGEQPFVSGWVWQTAYNRDQEDLPEVDLDQYPWRAQGPEILVGEVPGYCFHETHLDAGVWLAPVAMVRAVPLLEELSAWGYAQSTWQRCLRRIGVRTEALDRFVAVHQHHGVWARNFDVATSQYQRFGRGW